MKTKPLETQRRAFFHPSKVVETPMQKALAELWEAAASEATVAQIDYFANKHGVQAWQLEGFYFDQIERPYKRLTHNPPATAGKHIEIWISK